MIVHYPPHLFPHLHPKLLTFRQIDIYFQIHPRASLPPARLAFMSRSAVLLFTVNNLSIPCINFQKIIVSLQNDTKVPANSWELQLGVQVLKNIKSQFEPDVLIADEIRISYNISIHMKLSTLLLVVLLAVGINAQANSAILALSWLGGFCEWAKDCRPESVAPWDHQSFTIHGYWPQTRSNEKYGEFSLDIFDEKLLKDMKNYWPAQTRRAQKSSTFLWEHEYESHGSDFAEIYRYQHEDAFPGTNVTAEDITLQRTYFHYVIKLYKTLKVQKIEKSSYSKAEFADYLGINANSFSLVCNEKTATLQEIRICYDITPEGSKIVTCRSVSARNCKGNQIVLGEWKKSSPTAPVNKA